MQLLAAFVARFIAVVIGVLVGESAQQVTAIRDVSLLRA